MSQLEGKFDPLDQEFAILDQLLLATKATTDSKQPPSRQGVVTRSMAKKQELITAKPVPEEKKIAKRTVDKVPVYIGIAAEADKAFKAKLKELFVQGFDQMAKKFPENAKLFAKVSKTVTDLIKLGITDKNQ
jgi:predicted RNA-binding protein YlxR (DUF448 family)